MIRLNLPKKVKKTIDILNWVFYISVIITYLIITPYLFVQEYKTNEDFKNMLACERVEHSFDLGYFEIEECPFEELNKKLVGGSKNLILFVILFWGGLIFEKDIYPKIKDGTIKIE